MSEHTDATEDRPDDDDLELAREDREQLGEDNDEGEPQPWAKLSSGDAE